LGVLQIPIQGPGKNLGENLHARRKIVVAMMCFLFARKSEVLRRLASDAFFAASRMFFVCKEKRSVEGGKN
jgi:hypothetical protein